MADIDKGVLVGTIIISAVVLAAIARVIMIIFVFS